MKTQHGRRRKYGDGENKNDELDQGKRKNGEKQKQYKQKKGKTRKLKNQDN